MQIAKWGNSLAVRLPASVVEALRLKEGDEIDIHVDGEREFAVARKPSRQDFLNRLRAYGGAAADFKFDREEVNAGNFFDAGVLIISPPTTQQRPIAPKRWFARAERSAFKCSMKSPMSLDAK